MEVQLNIYRNGMEVFGRLLEMEWMPASMNYNLTQVGSGKIYLKKMMLLCKDLQNEISIYFEK